MDRPRPSEALQIITIASCFADLEPGDRFDRWPYHVTIESPFLVDGMELRDISSSVARLAATTAPFTIVGGEQAKFDGNNTVRLIEDPTAFHALHAMIHGIVQNNGGEHIGERYIYQPHITRKRSMPGWLQRGREQVVSSIDVVKRDPDDNDIKTVLARYALCGQTRLD